MDKLPIQRAIVSLTDKTEIRDLGKFLHEHGVEIVSTGGTARELENAGLSVTGVDQVTGFPEILGGRVKTLHPKIHAGVLADKKNPEHMHTLEDMDIRTFDLICVNLYDFHRAVNEEMGLKEGVEQIDIGGPTLLRAGAKNLDSVCVLPSPEFYPEFRENIHEYGAVSGQFRKKTAAYVFGMTSQYDRMIAEYLENT